MSTSIGEGDLLTQSIKSNTNLLQKHTQIQTHSNTPQNTHRHTQR